MNGFIHFGLFLIDYGVIWIPLACAMTAIPETRKTGMMMLVGLGTSR